MDRLTDQERQRLAAILGLLGSDHAGERAAAGLQAEAFRKKHGLTWAELLAVQSEKPIPEPPPAPPPRRPPRRATQPYLERLGIMVAIYGTIFGIALLNAVIH